MSYECHITIQYSPNFVTELEGLCNTLGWKYSQIHGDPLLGKHPFAYATKHFPSTENVNMVMIELNQMAKFLTEARFKVIRRKIELVIYDSKREG